MHASLVLFQVPYGIYYLQMNTFLFKLKMPCMPQFLIKSPLWLTLFKGHILCKGIEVRGWLISRLEERIINFNTMHALQIFLSSILSFSIFLIQLLIISFGNVSKEGRQTKQTEDLFDYHEVYEPRRALLQV
jgi:hypothetical protein